MKPYIALGVRNRTLMEGYGLLESYRRKVPGTACQIEKAIDVGDSYAVRLCYERGDRSRIRVLMEQEIREGKYDKKFFDSIDLTYKTPLADIKSFADTSYYSLDADELLVYFERFFEIYVTTVHPMVLAIYASDLQDVFEVELLNALDKKESEKLLDYTALLLTPTRLTTVQKEEQILFELQDSFEQNYPSGAEEEYQLFVNKDEIKTKFENLAKDFGWFHAEYLGEARTVAEYQAQIWERILELRAAEVAWSTQISPLARLQDIILQQEKFFARPKTTLLKQLTFAMQEFLVVLDFSKADLVEGIYYARPLLEELAKRTGLNSWIEVRYLLKEEIEDFIRSGKKIDPTYIAERQKHWLCKLEDDTITTYFGADALRVGDEILEKEVIPEAGEFKGLPAYPGKVRGIACVITSAADRTKFKQGQILVTIDTTTELTSIIKKSVAIVADQGGLLSHTAIVAREFKIPCIVQTRIGTKVIKDGDMVEVDADSGVVRVIQ